MRGPRTFAAILALALGAAATGAHAYDLRFVGQSRATPLLKRDIISTIAAYSKSRYQCSFPFSVESSAMPAGWEPHTQIYRISAPGRIYERWLVNLCGHKRSFLVGMWPTSDGGASFKTVEILPGQAP